MIHGEKDPTFAAYLRQTGLKALGLYSGALDNWEGKKTEAALTIYKYSWLYHEQWPFVAHIVGADIVVEDIAITCFGGPYDPQDNGETASGVSTLTPISGVSIPMNGKQLPHLSDKEHEALDNCPIPAIPFFTKVEITIDGLTTIPQRGVIDLGPSRTASTPGFPHALDLTPWAAVPYAPSFNVRELASTFEKRGSFRIINGAYLAHELAKELVRSLSRC